MKTPLLLLFASLMIAIFTNPAAAASADYPPQLVFYGGDFDPNNPNANGLANENDRIVPQLTVAVPYGAATYQNFIYRTDECWLSGCYVTGLFTNNLSAISPTSAYWEIRSGVSEGNGGTLIASGTGSGNNFRHTPTGRSGFGYTEYQDLISGLYLTVEPDTPYWFAVVPNDAKGASRSFNSNTFGLNAVGTQISNEQYFNSPFFGAHFTNTQNEGTYPTFSSGVLDWLVRDPSVPQPPIPEPSTIMLLGTGTLAAGGVVRRRLFR